MLFGVAGNRFEQHRIESVVQVRLLPREMPEVARAFVLVADERTQGRSEFRVRRRSASETGRAVGEGTNSTSSWRRRTIDWSSA